MIPARFNRQNLNKAIRNPDLIRGEINRLGTWLNSEFHSKLYSNTGVFVMDEDWDNLIILDACRYDAFAEVSTLDGELVKKKSRGSHTAEFIEENFKGREMHDTVYISSNPHISTIQERNFHSVVNLFEDGWDQELETVPPDIVANEMKNASDRFPEKRIIGHFLQPHFPYIGNDREIPHRGYKRDGWSPDENLRDLWQNVRYGLVERDFDTVYQMYEDNLREVINVIEDLLPYLEGKTVITSDHGNLFGERLFPIPVTGISHPPGIRKPVLIDIPWLIIEKDDRRNITSDSPLAVKEVDDSIVEDRLADLGYM